MDYTVPHFLDGKTLETPDAEALPIYNPALGEVIGKVNIASQALCNQAVDSAKQALQFWSATPAPKRAQVLFKFRTLLEKYQQDLAQMITREHGKTVEDAKGSVARAIELVELHCGIVTQLQGTLSMNVAHQVDCYTLRQPLGVCVGVSPFNFPVMVPVWMMIPAIACGNTFILKPSEQDPSAPIRLLELLTQAGLPDGVAQCVQGNKTTVDYLITHPDVKACTAVASTPVAETIYKTAVGLGKRAHTFGSAKNHGVVMPDADLALAAQAIVGAAYGAAGERCMALSVIITVGDDTAEALIARMKPLIEAMRIGPGTSSACDMGPLVSRRHLERVREYIARGVEEKAHLVVDGREFKHPDYPQGYFLGPSLFDRVTPDMAIYQEEIFGPVLVLLRVADFEEALRVVNQHQYGNGTAIFTRDGFYAREYIERVQVGMVGINIPIPVPIANHPFGGWKRSSFGDNPMHGLESVHFYTQSKTVTSKWPSVALSDLEFSMISHR